MLFFTVDGGEDEGGFLAQAGTAELPYSEVSHLFLPLIVDVVLQHTK